MKNNLYLTQVNFKNSPRSKSMQMGNIKNKKNTSSAYVTKNTGFFSAKKNMVEYIINDQTQYADLNKCENFYKELFYKNYKEYNSAKSQLSQMHLRSNELDSMIEKELVYSAKIEGNDIVEFYDKILDDVGTKLIFHEKDYLCYQNILRRTSRQNIDIKRKLNDFLSLDDKNKKLFDKYKVISLTAKRALKRQKGLYNDMKEYENRCNDVFDEEIEGKKLKFNELEYNVFKIKSGTAEIEKSLAEIKELIIERVEDIKNLKKKNIKIKENIIAIKNKYMKTKTKLLKIYKKLKVKSLEEIIKRFKNERIQYQGYNSQFLNLNKEISEKNTIFTELSYKIKELKGQIKSLQKEENIVPSENIPDLSFQSEDLKTKLLNEENSGLFLIVMEKHKILKNFCSFMLENDKQLKKLINKTMEIKKIRVHKGIKVDAINLEDSKLTLYNSEYNITTINQISDWNSYERNLIMVFFNNFQYNIMYLFTSYVMSISHEIYNKRNTPQNLLNIKPIIIPIFQSELNIILDDYITKALFHLENKYKILSRSEREIFKDHKPIIEDNKKRKIHLSTVFSNYYRKKTEHYSVDISMLNSIKPKLYLQLGKFTNQLVTNEVHKTNKKLYTGGSNKNILRRKEPEAFLTNKEKIRRKEAKKKEMLKKKFAEADSYEEPSAEEKEEKAVENKNIFGYKCNMHEDIHLLYKRIGDIHNLEKIYLRDKETEKVKNGNFEEIYFNFKKKIEKNKKKMLMTLKKKKESSEKIVQRSMNDIINLPSQFNQEIKSNVKQSNIKYSLNNTQNNNVINLTNSYIQKRQLSNGHYTLREKYLADLFNDEYLNENQEEIKKFEIDNRNLNKMYIRYNRRKSTSGLSSTRFSVGNAFSNSSSFFRIIIINIELPNIKEKSKNKLLNKA